MKKILIIGGGFGGIRAALDLDRKLSPKEAMIVVVDRNSYHLFSPALYEIASAYGVSPDPYQLKLRRAISIPYADIFRHTKINFRQGEIVAVDWQKKEVMTGGGYALAFDHLIFGLGSETNTFGVSGAVEYAFKFKTIDEAVFLNQRIGELYQKAARGRHSLPIKFIIAGAGFNGIELAGELACCVEKIKNACRLHQGCVSIEIIEAGPKILPDISDKERAIIRKRLTQLGVKIIENAPIKEVGPNFVITEGEGGERKLWADFVVWTAGVRASSLLKKMEELPLDNQGKIRVNKFLQVERIDNTWALGDNTAFMDEGGWRTVPGLAYVAVAQGKIIAENIKRQIKDGCTVALKPYHPFYEAWIVPVGGKFAVAHLGRRWITSGLGGWVIRLLVDLRYFVSILPWSRAWGLFEEETKLFIKND